MKDTTDAAALLGKKGGEVTKQKYGREHFVKMGKKGKRKAKKRAS